MSKKNKTWRSKTANRRGWYDAEKRETREQVKQCWKGKKERRKDKYTGGKH